MPKVAETYTNSSGDTCSRVSGKRPFIIKGVGSLTITREREVVLIDPELSTRSEILDAVWNQARGTDDAERAISLVRSINEGIKGNARGDLQKDLGDAVKEAAIVKNAKNLLEDGAKLFKQDLTAHAEMFFGGMGASLKTELEDAGFVFDESAGMSD